MYTFFLCIDVPFAHTAALIKIKCIIHAPLCILSLQGTFRNLLYCIRNCYIRIVCLMSGNQFSKIKIYGNICICHNNIFFFLFSQIIQCMIQRLDTSTVQIHSFLRIRRPDGQSTVLTNQIPLTTGTKVIHQRMIFFTHQYGYAIDAAVYHAGEHKVDQTVTACKRNGSHQPLINQFRDKRIIVIRENNSQCIYI